MTKREICEKEMGVLWNALLEADGGANNVMMSIASVMKDLILDLAAPDDHFADAGEMVREEDEPPPGVLAKPGKDGGIEWCWCNKCYGAADVVHDPFGDGNDWSYCKKCGVSFRLKRGEEGK